MSSWRLLHQTVIFGLLLAILATHGLGLHRHGHVPQSDQYGTDHTHKADFHLSSFLTEDAVNDTQHDDHTSWTKVEFGASAIAKKFVDIIVFAIVSLAILLILKWLLQSTSTTLTQRCNNARPKNVFRITPQLRAPPQ